MLARHFFYLSMAVVFGVLSLLQSSPYMMWAMFELNLFMTVPFLLNRSQFCHPAKGAIIYFGCQCIASIFMISGLILQDLGWAGGFSLLILGFLCKLGVFPFYSWVPRTMVSLSWSSCLMLLTFQKVFPILCMPEVLVPSIAGYGLMFILGVSGLMSGSMMCFQTHLKSGLGYSSVLNMSWVLSLKLINSDSMGWAIPSNVLVWGFLLSYMPVVLSVVGLFIVSGAQTLSDISLQQWGRFRWVSCVAVLSMGGVPGLLGFIPKLAVMSNMSSHCWILMVVLLISSAFSILWYTSPVMMVGVSIPSNRDLLLKGNAKYLLAISCLINLLGAPLLMLALLWIW